MTHERGTQCQEQETNHYLNFESCSDIQQNLLHHAHLLISQPFQALQSEPEQCIDVMCLYAPMTATKPSAGLNTTQKVSPSMCMCWLKDAQLWKQAKVRPASSVVGSWPLAKVCATP
jgi:hypothetical protein